MLESKTDSGSNWLLHSLSWKPPWSLVEMISLEHGTETSLSDKAPLGGTTEAPLWMSGIESLPLNAEVLLLMYEADSNLLSLVDSEEMCSLNLLRYKESRYCSKYTTSSSNIPISFISSFAA